MQGPEIQRLIQQLSKLPGLGPRSGRRLALHLLKKKDQVMNPLIDALKTAEAAITTCSVCHNLDTTNPCQICVDYKRDPSQVCVVEDVADLWAMERANVFKGHYHILGGVLSAIDGKGPAQLTIHTLTNRLNQGQIKELILALSATVDGQTTLFYLTELFKPTGVQITTLAQGVPLGGELDYLDDGTLTTAFMARRGV
jgi:recombination protein RecR